MRSPWLISSAAGQPSLAGRRNPTRYVAVSPDASGGPCLHRAVSTSAIDYGRDALDDEGHVRSCSAARSRAATRSHRSCRPIRQRSRSLREHDPDLISPLRLTPRHRPKAQDSEDRGHLASVVRPWSSSFLLSLLLYKLVGVVRRGPDVRRPLEFFGRLLETLVEPLTGHTPVYQMRLLTYHSNLTPT